MYRKCSCQIVFPKKEDIRCVKLVDKRENGDGYWVENNQLFEE